MNKDRRSNKSPLRLERGEGQGEVSKVTGSISKDHLSRERRSWNMSRIRGKNTTPELRVRSLLHRLGYRFRLHVRIPIDLPQRRGDAERNVAKVKHGIGISLSASNGERAGVRCRNLSTINSQPKTFWVCPDILLPKLKTAIFVHGCFWHRHKGCKNCTTPTNRREWWLAKLNGNAARDEFKE